MNKKRLLRCVLPVAIFSLSINTFAITSNELKNQGCFFIARNESPGVRLYSVSKNGLTIEYKIGAKDYTAIYEGQTKTGKFIDAPYLNKESTTTLSNEIKLMLDNPFSLGFEMKNVEEIKDEEIIKDDNKILEANKDSLLKYLKENYVRCQTDYNTFTFTFTILENKSIYSQEDFEIWVDIDNYSELSNIKYTSSQRKEMKSELRNHMEKIAKDLIEKFPDKKFIGCYNQSYYTYSYIKVGYNRINYCSWSNFTYDFLKEYENTKASTFRWNTDKDEDKW